jgi:serine/threonine protein kinase
MMMGTDSNASRAESETQVAAKGQRLRDRYVLDEFLERRQWPFGGGGWPIGGGGRSPTPSPSNGVPGKSFPTITRRPFSSPEHLGTGSFGDVWSAYDSVTKKTVAVKIFYTGSKYLTWRNANRNQQSEFSSAMKECSLVMQIMKYKSSDPVGASRICECYEEHVSDAEGTSKPVFLVMEMCGTSLTSKFINHYKQRRSTNVPGAREMTKQMLEGLDFMNSFQTPLIHHDLKPDNVVVTDDGMIKIIDWGAMVLGDQRNRYARVAATPLYTPPECSQGRCAFAMPAHSYDVYAVGLMYMEMVCPSLDYQTWYYSRPLTASKITSLISRTCRSLSSSEYSKDVNLMGHMVNSDPAKRPTPSTLLKQSVFGSTKAPPQGAMEVPESAVVPKPEADDAHADPLEGKHIFDPADATETPSSGGDVALSTELELMPPKAYRTFGKAGLQVRSIVAAPQTDGAEWTLERCVLQCDSGVSTPEEYEMTKTLVVVKGDYIYAQFDASITDGPKKCSLYAIGTKVSGGNSQKYRSLKKSFSLGGFWW